MSVRRTRRGVRIEEGDAILSELRRSPGPTHTLFDVLAAAVFVHARGPRFAMLGFGGGGIVAPLRALGFADPVTAVDLSQEYVPLYRSLSRAWGGQVNVHRSDAATWLRRLRPRQDVILEDLSVPGPWGVTKPPVSIEELPHLMRSRLRLRGVVVTNVLPVSGWTWSRLLPRLRSQHREARVVSLDRWENRILIAGAHLDSARAIGRSLRAALCRLGSLEARGLTVRTLRPPSRELAGR